MPFTHADYLPSYEELDVKEVNLSSVPLKAGAIQFGKYCDNQSKVSLQPCMMSLTIDTDIHRGLSSRVLSLFIFVKMILYLDDSCI